MTSEEFARRGPERCAKVELDFHFGQGQPLLQITVSPLSKPARGVKVWAHVN
jgi:hypothetical protein